MRLRILLPSLVLATMTLAVAAVLGAGARPPIVLHSERSSPEDLEIEGDIPSLPPNASGFLRYDDLRRLPQTSFHPVGDGNFPHGAPLSGVSLDEIGRAIGAPMDGQLIAAICDDKYEAHYTAAYRAVHGPILVLRIDGISPTAWSLKVGKPYGPYLVSHARFKPAFHILSHADEAQIPYGVVELKFLSEREVLASIEPPVRYTSNLPVMQGYRIAFQNCFRCHNAGSFGGRKAGVPWRALAREAARDPAGFAAIVHDPKSRNSYATMPGNPSYDAATLQAVTAYFQAWNDRGGQ